MSTFACPQLVKNVSPKGATKQVTVANSGGEGSLERLPANASSGSLLIEIDPRSDIDTGRSKSGSPTDSINAQRGFLKRVTKRFRQINRFVPTSGSCGGVSIDNRYALLEEEGEDCGAAAGINARGEGAFDDIEETLLKLTESSSETEAIAGRKRAEISKTLRKEKDEDGNTKYSWSLINDYLDGLFGVPAKAAVLMGSEDRGTESQHVDEDGQADLTPESVGLFKVDSRKAANHIVRNRKTLRACEGVTYFLKCKYFFAKRDPTLINNMVRDARTYMTGKGKQLNSEGDYYVLSQAVMAAFLVDTQELKMRATMKDRENLDNIKHLNAATQGDLGYTSIFSPLGRRTDRFKHAFMEHNTLGSVTKLSV